ncbi:hypothetical protein [Mycobacterium sp.]|uniref:hypothetical protein n=1 Tax=Mycobacterium sp. TaxID=1785 RepID=UPI003C72B986
MRHPRVGELQLYQNQLNVPHPNCEGQHLLIYRAKPRSDSARALEELRSLSAAPLWVERSAKRGAERGPHVLRLRVSLPVMGINANSPVDRRRADS